ncbi:MAG: AAA family ATPase [Chloroflexota bacterium]
MVTWQSQELIRLVNEKYPNWEGFTHADFVSDEIDYKRKAVAKTRELIGRKAFKELLAAGNYDEIISRIEKACRLTNLMYIAQPRNGDLAILYADGLNKWEFCQQIYSLLHDERPSPDRLDSFSEYCTLNNLPNRWPFATYLLFMNRPSAEVFIKPRVAKWFMQFMGFGEIYVSDLSADMYERYKKSWHGLKGELGNFGDYPSKDMIDIQSLIWVAYDVSQKRVEGLDVKGQIELDRPTALREPEPVYDVNEVLKYEPPEPDLAPTYSLKDCAEATGFDVEKLKAWCDGIERRKQALFYGPPGTGKTFIAKELAKHLIGGTDGFVETVQFHPAYDYADFMEGIRPQTDGSGRMSWKNRPGVFLNFCNRAANYDGPAILIVDEMNRGNLARILGETMLLLEYRNESIKLASGEEFSIPANVRIIGTMNTADRSIALLDHALRRRFASIHLAPELSIIERYHKKNKTGFDPAGLIKLLEELNADINDPAYALGISYFLTPNLKAELPQIWQMEIEPYLEEYFFNQPDRVGRYRWEQVKQVFN